MTAIITIASIKPGPKRSIVFTTEGQEYGFWTNKADALDLKQGVAYNVETEMWKDDEKSGKPLFNIVRAKRITMGKAMAARQAPTPSEPPAAPFRTPEMFFVQDILGHYIDAGQCPPTELIRYINAIRYAWNKTLGETGPFVSGGGTVPYDQAAE